MRDRQAGSDNNNNHNNHNLESRVCVLCVRSSAEQGTVTVSRLVGRRSGLCSTGQGGEQRGGTCECQAWNLACLLAGRRRGHQQPTRYRADVLSIHPSTTTKPISTRLSLALALASSINREYVRACPPSV